ncbi:MAG: DUF1573 domain-containing protein [Gemmataceae bacterium]
MLRFAALAALLMPALLQAQLSCTQASHDLGSVQGGRVVRHSFLLENTGRETLQITEIRTGCGCVRGQPGQLTLRPGQRTSLPIEVHTVTQAAGANVWGAEVRWRSESGITGICNVRLTATLVPEVQLSPATMVLHPATAALHPFILIERRADPLELTSISTTSPHIKAQASKPVKQGNSWTREICLTVESSCPAGRQDCLLVLTTSDARFPELRAPFVVLKRDAGSVRAIPAEHEWLAVHNEALASRVSLLHSDSDQPITIENVRCSHPAFRATWASGTRGTVRFVVDRAQVPADGLQALAEVKLSKPLATTLNIPLRVRLK